MPKSILTNERFAEGRVIRKPVGHEPGYWVGCPGAFFDETDRMWYLTYRIRRPRGVAPDRGGEVRIARSPNLERWEDVLTVTKDRYQSASIERSCLHRGRDGLWRYFTSYVHPSDGRWCTAVMKAPKVEQLDASKACVIFTGPPLNLEGVKDPWILEHEGVYHLFLSIATPTPKTAEGSHATLDIFNTGECKSATGLAVSRDLDAWEWQGVVFAPGANGWDQYCRRINSVVPLAANGAKSSGKAPRFLAFYDGSASHVENYEEKCGLAASDDLRTWASLTPERPAFTSPHASTSLRYLEAKRSGTQWNLFYEFAGPDGSHDMRVISCEPSALVAAATAKG
jgi:hypothetical protein